MITIRVKNKDELTELYDSAGSDTMESLWLANDAGHYGKAMGTTHRVPMTARLQEGLETGEGSMNLLLSTGIVHLYIDEFEVIPEDPLKDIYATF